MKEDTARKTGVELECDVIRDLLVLYEDEACSQQSRKLVKEHLDECPTCVEYLKQIQRTDEILTPEVNVETAQEDRAVKRSFRKIRHRWAISLLAVLMLFPLMGIGLMGYHESKGDGIAYSNLDDIYRCIRFLKCIERKQFDKAAAYMDFTAIEEYKNSDSASASAKEPSESDLRQKFVR